MTMEVVVAVVVVVALVFMTSAGDDACGIRPVFSTKEQSASFFPKSSWAAGPGEINMYEEETLFVRSRHCPVRVRREVEENETKSGSYTQSLRNGSNSKDAAKKQPNSHKKLKGSKRKRKKEKRKRFRKKKKSVPSTKTKS